LEKALKKVFNRCQSYTRKTCGSEKPLKKTLEVTKTQMTYWNIMQKLFESQPQLSIKDVQNKIKRARTTVLNLFDFFEEGGLITTKIEGRERIAEQTGNPIELKLMKHDYVRIEIPEELYAWLKENIKGKTITEFIINLIEEYRRKQTVHPLAGEQTCKFARKNHLNS
jgi:pyruvate formate-lyase activating enzyme-like uncharacterized protein